MCWGGVLLCLFECMCRLEELRLTDSNHLFPIFLELNLLKHINEVLQKYLVYLLSYFQLSNIFEYLKGDY